MPRSSSVRGAGELAAPSERDLRPASEDLPLPPALKARTARIGQLVALSVRLEDANRDRRETAGTGLGIMRRPSWSPFEGNRAVVDGFRSGHGAVW